MKGLQDGRGDQLRLPVNTRRRARQALWKNLALALSVVHAHLHRCPLLTNQTRNPKQSANAASGSWRSSHLTLHSRATVTEVQTTGEI